MGTKTFENIVVFGASSLGKEIMFLLQEYNKKYQKYQILGFIDDNEKIHDKLINKFPVLGGINWFKNNENVSCVIALGEPQIRKKIISKLKKFEVNFSKIIHPKSIVSENVKIGPGTIIQAGCIINPDVKIGSHTFLNINVTVGSDCKIDNFVTISPGVNISAENKIEDEVFVGAGSVIKEAIKIEKNSIIGAGTTVVKNVPKNSLCIGIPGKSTKKNKEHVFE